MGDRRLRLLLVSTDRSFAGLLESALDGLASVVRDVPDTRDARRSTDGEGARVDVLLWDVGSEAGLLEEAAVNLSDDLPVVILAPPGRMRESARRMGPAAGDALAVLPRDAAPGAIVAACSAVIQGLAVYHPRALPRALRGSAGATSGVSDVRGAADAHGADPVRRTTGVPSGAAVRAAEPLTPREQQVLALLADGLGNKSIASALSVSTHTAKYHVAAILTKLGAASRTAAVVAATRSGLLKL
jgi:two-component system nitrate/nitrite response regulator NarL